MNPEIVSDNVVLVIDLVFGATARAMRQFPFPDNGGFPKRVVIFPGAGAQSRLLLIYQGAFHNFLVTQSLLRDGNRRERHGVAIVVVLSQQGHSVCV